MQSTHRMHVVAKRAYFRIRYTQLHNIYIDNIKLNGVIELFAMQSYSGIKNTARPINSQH